MVCFIYICVICLNVQIDVYIDIYILVSNEYSIYIFLWLFNQVMQRIAQNLGGISKIQTCYRHYPTD